MAFKFHKSLGTENFPYVEERPTTAEETYVKGEALKLASGTLTKAGATDSPTHIAAESYVAPATDNRAIKVYPVLPAYEYESTFAANASALKEGTLVTLHTDGLQVTATATAGIATISRKLGTGASGTAVIVRFLPVDTIGVS